MSAAAAARMNAGLKMSGLLLVPQARRRERAVCDDILLIWAASDAAEWNSRIEFLPL